MIPEAAITHWRNVVPWPQDAQVEQDLILSRALIEIFQEALLLSAQAVGDRQAFKERVSKVLSGSARSHR